MANEWHCDIAITDQKKDVGIFWLRKSDVTSVCEKVGLK